MLIAMRKPCKTCGDIDHHIGINDKNYGCVTCNKNRDKTRKQTKEQNARRNATTAATTRKARWRQKHSEYAKNYHRAMRYGITPERVALMLKYQYNKCKICLKEFMPANKRGNYCIDHDHATGKVRGLLCRKCNLAIGALSENAFIFARAVAYLHHYGSLPAEEVSWLSTRFVDLPSPPSRLSPSRQECS